MSELLLFFKIKSTTNFNSFVYHFKQIPILKKLVSKDVYKSKVQRIVWNVIRYVVKNVWYLMRQLMYFFMIGFALQLIRYLGTVDVTSDKFVQSYEMLFLVMSVIFGSLFKNVTSSTIDKYYIVRVMKADCREFLRYEFLSIYLYKLLFMVPLMLVMGSITNTPLNITAMMIGAWIASRVFGCYFELLLSKFKKETLITNVLYVLAFFGTVGAIVLILLERAPFISWEIVLGFYIILAIGIRLYVNKSFDYYAFGNKRFALSQIIDAKAIAIKQQKNIVRMSDKDFKVSNRIYHKKGFDFFNALFVQRHRRLLLKPILYTSVAIILGIVIMLVVGYFAPYIVAEFGRGMINSLGGFFFLLYFVNRGERYANALFFNCDVSMLRYSFYRTSKNILVNFWIRFRTLVVLNMIPTVLLVIFTLILFSFSGIAISDIIMFVVAILEVSLLYSIHYLFMYTMFQPYTENMEQKSHVVSITNGIVYMIIWQFNNMSLPVMETFVVVTIVTIIYASFGSWAIFKFAPKRFRLR